jgi:hypothetical protein
MLGVAFNSVAGFDDGSGIPKNFKDKGMVGFYEERLQRDGNQRCMGNCTNVIHATWKEDSG